MKRTKTTLSLATALLLASAIPMAAQAGPGAYVGGSIGNARLDDNFDGFNIDTDTDAYRLFGGIQFGDSFGVEAGYLNFGDFTESVDLGGLLSRTDITGDNFSLTGDWTVYEFDVLETDVISLGFNYRF
jgi:OOP family OmpA-OmpF porin